MVFVPSLKINFLLIWVYIQPQSQDRSRKGCVNYAYYIYYASESSWVRAELPFPFPPPPLLEKSISQPQGGTFLGGFFSLLPYFFPFLNFFPVGDPPHPPPPRTIVFCIIYVPVVIWNNIWLRCIQYFENSWDDISNKVLLLAWLWTMSIWSEAKDSMKCHMLHILHEKDGLYFYSGRRRRWGEWKPTVPHPTHVFGGPCSALKPAPA